MPAPPVVETQSSLNAFICEAVETLPALPAVTAFQHHHAVRPHAIHAGEDLLGTRIGFSTSQLLKGIARRVRR